MDEVPSPAIGLIIASRDRGIELLDDLLTHALGPIRGGNHDEVIAADVPDKIIRVATRSDRLEKNLGGEPDDVIPTGKAVVVVEDFEMIQVGVANRQRAPLR